MATPTTKDQFKEYCLRSLGKPVIEINVHDEQVDDRVDEALKYFVDMCLPNKYSAWYFAIVGAALKRNWSKLSANCYVERHHYVPAALGGTDDYTVYLTAREHFICHVLLTKMLVGKPKAKMVWAVMIFKNYKNRYMNSYLYEKVKSNVQHSEVSKQKMSDTRKRLGTFKGENNPMFGKLGMNSPLYGFKQSEEHKLKRINAIKGRKQSTESRLKMSANRPKGPSGKRWFNNGVIETFGLPETKPNDYVFGRLKRAS